MSSTKSETLRASLRVSTLRGQPVANYVLRQGDRMVVGREGAVDIHLDDAAISRRHATLALEPDGLHITDHDSLNGTFLGPHPIPPNVVTRYEGEPLTLGAFVIKVEVQGGRSSARSTSKMLALPPVPREDFEVMGLIGQGAAGRVWAARERATERRVAIKVLHPDLEPDDRQRFLRETELLCQVESPFVVACLDVRSLPGGEICMVMELIQGPTVTDRILAQGALSVPESITLAEQIAQALVVLEAKGIVHRDVKPANILLTRLGHAKLGDFGLAKRIGGPSLTNSDLGLGTLHYVAPEQTRDAKRVDGRADIYGLGATLYEMISGRPPLRLRGTLLERIEKIATVQPPPLTTHCQHCPLEVAALVHRMLAKDPSDRPQRAEDLGQELVRLRRNHFADWDDDYESPETRALTRPRLELGG